eukprot:GHVH01011504.1.p1 GENE.GHVH01011504.1~~GHVH01011504.1.p1  ORF type:complete len:226 (+),score=22.89 GHVH01011504.1:176-853(+)
MKRPNDELQTTTKALNWTPEVLSSSQIVHPDNASDAESLASMRSYILMKGSFDELTEIFKCCGDVLLKSLPDAELRYVEVPGGHEDDSESRISIKCCLRHFVIRVSDITGEDENNKPMLLALKDFLLPKQIPMQERIIKNRSPGVKELYYDQLSRGLEKDYTNIPTFVVYYSKNCQECLVLKAVLHYGAVHHSLCHVYAYDLGENDTPANVPFVTEVPACFSVSA